MLLVTRSMDNDYFFNADGEYLVVAQQGSLRFRTEFGVIARVNEIMCLETDSVLKPIDSRGNTQDGANLHFSLNDELHAWKGRDLYAVLETAMGSRMQPMMWNITTAGADQSGICYELRQYLEKVLQGVIRDEQFFGIVYTIGTTITIARAAQDRTNQRNLRGNHSKI